MTEVAPGVFRLGSPIVNWYIVADGDRLTAIDAGLPAFASTLDADLAAHGLARGAIESVVLTHSDADHTGMALTMREAGARVLIHADDAGTLAKPGAKTCDAAPPKLLPAHPGCTEAPLVYLDEGQKLKGAVLFYPSSFVFRLAIMVSLIGAYCIAGGS